MNYDNRQFQVRHNASPGEVDSRTMFTYHQKDSVVWGTYQGGDILIGTLTGIVNEDGKLNFAYQHVNLRNEIMTGRCVSTPEVLPDGRLRLHEQWEWTCGTFASGKSVIEEIAR